MAESELHEHVIIVGHGRSGTNMVLDLFDCHRNTFCRNEPNELVGTSFFGLGDNMFPSETPDDFAMKWRAAMAQTIRTSGARDRFGVEKDYFRSALHARLGQSLMLHRKFRACILPRSGGAAVEEWPSPGLYYNRDALSRAFPVLKILLSPAWVLRAHDLIHTQRVVHVIRRPQDFVQSWWNRYVTNIGSGPQKVFADNQPSLMRILQHFNREDEMPGQYSLANLVTSELWRWRYMNEVMLDQLSVSPRYIKLAYEDVMRDKLHWAKKIYGFAGLEMTPASRQSVETMENTLFRARKPDGLDAGLVTEAIDKVVADSPWQNQLLNTVPAPSDGIVT